MNRGDGQQGYTIIETLIFLAVSAAMFIVAVGLIGGRQNRVMFQNATRDLETRLTDIANDVTTGFYANPGTISCKKTAGGPDLSVNTPGDCVFLGTVVKFGADDGPAISPERFWQMTLVGLRTAVTTNDNIENLGEAMPKPLQNNILNTALLNGASVQCVAVGNSCTPGNPNAAIGFFTSFQTLSGDLYGGIKTDLYVYNNINLTDNQALTINNLTHGNGANRTNYANVTPSNPNYNPSQGVVICLRSSGTNQYALIHIGADNSNKMTVFSEIKDIAGGNLCS